jgi:hypothetical protein
MLMATARRTLLPARGPGGGPHVRIFDGGTELQLQNNTSDSFYAYDAIFSGGAYVGGETLSGVPCF